MDFSWHNQILALFQNSAILGNFSKFFGNIFLYVKNGQQPIGAYADRALHYENVALPFVNNLFMKKLVFYWCSALSRSIAIIPLLMSAPAANVFE